MCGTVSISGRCGAGVGKGRGLLFEQAIHNAPAATSTAGAKRRTFRPVIA
jgi:hypothetical protein